MKNKLFRKVIKVSYELFDLPKSRAKHFTFLTQRNKIVSFGWNFNKKSHPMAERLGYRYPFLHSELHAFLNFSQFPVEKANFSKYDLINVRIGLDRTIRISKPCEVCMDMIRRFGINQIWYTNNQGNFVCL